MRVFGLTGGIATGKSTVSQMFHALGAHIVDADLIAREVVAPGQPALAEIQSRFPEVFDSKGTLDRSALAERVFNSETERRSLNAILHPKIHQVVQDRLQSLRLQRIPFCLYDAPLLVENRLHEGMDGIIVVTAPREVQIQRLMARNQLSREQAIARIDSQLPLEEKRKVATWVIDNGSDLKATQAQVKTVWEALHERSHS
jgi:dephospho-CoA kinase